MKSKLLSIVILVFLIQKPEQVYSNTITAISCSQSNVQAAINSANDGDVVLIPAGTCTWSQTIVLNLAVGIGKSLILKGAGIGLTTIYDSVPKINYGGSLISISTKLGKAFRLTGFTFKTSSGLSNINYEGLIKINGTSKAFRFDHNQFLTSSYSGRAIFTSGYLFGVVDNNQFNTPNQALTVWHDGWGGNGNLWGDESWADLLSLGSGKAVYFEDNSVIRTLAGGSVDGWAGCRYVVRNNLFQNTHVDNHGTETSGRFRGIFSWEVYNNKFTMLASTYYTAFNVRGGTGVAFNNSLTVSGTGDYSSMIVLNNYRNADAFYPFGGCDGSSPWDKNYTDTLGNSIVYDTGTHTGTMVLTGILTDNSKSWTLNQWQGYSLRNVTQNWGSQIVSNSSNVISVKNSVVGGNRTWQPGDVYKIMKVEVGIDQVGRSTGNLILGNEYTPPPYPVAWPNQKLEPAHIWGNIKNNISFNTTSSTAYTIKNNRDYYLGIARPDYITYTYPHPLTLCGFTSDNNLPPTLTNFVYSSSVVCQDQDSVKFAVSADASASFSWAYSGTGATITGTSNIVSIGFSPAATTGTLTLSLTNSCGTSSVLALPITVKTCTVAGLFEQKYFENLIKIYPNPSSGIVTIITPIESEIYITNILGELIVTKKSISQETKLDLTYYKSGLYFVTVINGNNSNVIKLIKE